MIYFRNTKDIGCALCVPMFKNEFTIGKPVAGEDEFLWTCHYSNESPNNKIGMEENVPDLNPGKNKRTMDECCEMVYPEYYDNVTKLQPQMHETPDFMWMDFDLALPQNARRLEETADAEMVRLLKKKFQSDFRHVEDSPPETSKFFLSL